MTGIVIAGGIFIFTTGTFGKLKTWALSEIGVAQDNFQLAAVIELGEVPKQESEEIKVVSVLPEQKKIETKIPEQNNNGKNTLAPHAISAPVPAAIEIKNCSFASGQDATRQPIVINEIAWMGSMASANDEWIELKNISEDTVSLLGWQLKDKGDQISIQFDASFSVEPQGFILLERTDDNSVPAIAADAVYVGALSNSNEGVRLFDSKCNLIDEALAASDWPAGNPGERRTMERHTNLSWYTYTGSGSNGIMGTPLADNSVPMISTSTNYISPPHASGAETANAPAEDAGVVPPTNTIAALIISEIQISGASANDEFVELYNPSDVAISLTDWSLKRKSSSGTEYSLMAKSRLEGKTISPHGYFLLVNEEGYAGSVPADAQWAKSNTIANNNTVILYAPDGAVMDKVGFGEAQDFEGTAASNPEAGKSLARQGTADSNDNGKDFKMNSPTPKTAN